MELITKNNVGGEVHRVLLATFSWFASSRDFAELLLDKILAEGGIRHGEHLFRSPFSSPTILLAVSVCLLSYYSPCCFCLSLVPVCLLSYYSLCCFRLSSLLRFFLLILFVSSPTILLTVSVCLVPVCLLSYYSPCCFRLSPLLLFFLLILFASSPTILLAVPVCLFSSSHFYISALLLWKYAYTL